MSDVYKSDCGEAAPGQVVIAISVVICIVVTAIFSLLTMTCILARQVERKLAKTQQNSNLEPSVIIVEECKDLQRTLTSSLPQTMTLNSKDLLSFYDKLPEREEENNSYLMPSQSQAM